VSENLSSPHVKRNSLTHFRDSGTTTVPSARHFISQ
jgi:hypothetical protein